MKEKKEEPVKVYELHCSERGLDLIGTSIALVAAQVAEDDIMVLRLTIQLAALIRSFGGTKEYMVEYTTVIDQLAMLQGLTVCPDCGHFHSPKEL